MLRRDFKLFFFNTGMICVHIKFRIEEDWLRRSSDGKDHFIADSSIW